MHAESFPRGAQHHHLPPTHLTLIILPVRTTIVLFDVTVLYGWLLESSFR